MAGAYFGGLRPGSKPWPTCRARVEGDGTADCAGVGFGAVQAGGFLPVQATEVVKPRGRLVISRPVSTLERYWVQKS